MVETQRQEPKEKEEQISISGKFPVSFAQQLEGFFGGSSEESIPSPDFSPPGQNGNMFKGVSQEDLDAASRAVGPPPPGVQIPSLKQDEAQTQTQQEQPAGHKAMQFTGGGGGLPSQEEAFEYAMQESPPVQTKQEFKAEQKAPSWWRMMLADFARGAPGAGREEWNKRVDEAYQESIQKQIQERSEFERKQGIVGQYAVKPEDEMVTYKFGDREIEIQRKNIGQLAALFGKEYDNATDKNKQVSLRTLLPDDINAPDWHLPREEALQYAKFFIDQKNAGLGTGRDLLRTINPKLWQFLEDHDLAQATKLAKAKKTIQDQVTQRMPTEREQYLEAQAMDPIDDIGEPNPKPQLLKYLTNISRGQSSVELTEEGQEYSLKGVESISNADRQGYIENVKMMNHIAYGDQSPLYDYYKKELKEKGWHFKGERIPNDKKKARAKLRTMRNVGKVSHLQSLSFIDTHFGDFNRDFEHVPIMDMFIDPDFEMGLDPGAGRGEEAARKYLKENRTETLPPETPSEFDPETQIGEVAVKEFMQANRFSWDESVSIFKELGKEVIMGR